MKTFIHGLKKEWGRITWTSRRDLVRQTGIVICVSAATIGLISVFDSLALAVYSLLL